MAEVWLATQEGPEGFRKEVVIKRIRGLRSGDDDFRTMFLDEARLTARLNHPNIVQVHELGEDDGEFFVAMEYVEGCDLADVLQRDGKIDWPVAAHIVEQLLLALIFASELEIDGARLDVVHRDISPSNVLLSNSGHVKLADFGVAKAMSNHHRTQTGAIKGKLSYMSPEQVRAEPLDVRSDLFALGINLYEMVTGELPFGDGVRALHAIQEESPAPLPTSLPAGLRQFVEKALAKDRDERFDSPHDMHDALIDVMRNEAAHARQRDVAELVAIGPVAATAAAIPSQKPTEFEPESSTETAIVAPARPKEPERHRRLPWIFVGVLFGMLIAGGVSTYAFMSAPETPNESENSADQPNQDEQDELADDQDERFDHPKHRDKGKHKGKNGKGKRKKKDDKEDDEEKAEEQREEQREKQREEEEKRRKEAEKRLERERKKLERELEKKAKKARKKVLDDLLK